jgi:hypothetical protein
VYTGLGHTAYERYLHGGPIGAGDVLTQTITGLKNGVYAVTLELAASFTSERGFECPTGNGLSVAFANGTQENLEVIDRGWVSSVSPITIYATVTDGTLKYGIRNLFAAGNWYVANVIGIKYLGDEETYIRGDVNNDGSVDISDVVELVNIILNGLSDNPRADVNEDGSVDISDVVDLVNIVLR